MGLSRICSRRQNDGNGLVGMLDLYEELESDFNNTVEVLLLLFYGAVGILLFPEQMKSDLMVGFEDVCDNVEVESCFFVAFENALLTWELSMSLCGTGDDQGLCARPNCCKADKDTLRKKDGLQEQDDGLFRRLLWESRRLGLCNGGAFRCVALPNPMISPSRRGYRFD